MKTKEELKTLKDLEHSEDLKHQESKLVYSKILRAEAVKWVKSVRKHNNMRGWKKDEFITCMAISWIKHFFNLTEDYLK